MELAERIDGAVKRLNPSSVVVVTDQNVEREVFPLLMTSEIIRESPCVAICPGESHKNLESLVSIWETLEKHNATRSSVIVNVGGGMVTDIGGFAAATFKRGIRYVNVPTTLLGAVDAATGGKTAINFNGLKNEIGNFHSPLDVIISSVPFVTLPQIEILSGYGEILKTALIADKNLYQDIRDIKKICACGEHLENVMLRCVEIKNEIVELDPYEKGLRKVLNFGHTAGHAFEILQLNKSQAEDKIDMSQIMPHGICVAHGILVELILSHKIKSLDTKWVMDYATVLKYNFPLLQFEEGDIEDLWRIMAHDKKNVNADSPNFTLLEDIGKPVIDSYPSETEIKEALIQYSKMLVTF